MTKLCVPLTGSSCQQMVNEIASAAAAGVDMIELRLDYLQEWDDAAVRELLAAARRFPGEVIATCRIAAEGGHYDEDESQRISRMEFVGLSDGVDYLDIEYAAWKASANVRQKIGLVCDVNTDTDRPRRRLILSAHDFAATPANLDADWAIWRPSRPTWSRSPVGPRRSSIRSACSMPCGTASPRVPRSP